MKTLFVMDPLESLNVHGDSTYMLMLELRRRGAPVWCCLPTELRAEGGRARATCRPVEVYAGAPWFDPGEVEDRALGEFDVVWMRKDPPFDIEYIFATYLLDLAPPSTLVVNRAASLRDLNEKLATLRWPHLCAETLVTQEIPRALAWARALEGPLVVKPWDGNGGRGVLVSHSQDGNLRAIIEVLSAEGRRSVILQRYIPEIKAGDKRIILVEGEPVGWMLRVPQPGDHRGNMHVGARVEGTDLTPREREICATIGPTLRQRGLVFVGIDVIGDFLTEINVTSPTGIQEINRLMGTRLEAVVTDAVQARVDALRSGAQA